jgi:hypothetical protein
MALSTFELDQIVQYNFLYDPKEKILSYSKWFFT